MPTSLTGDNVDQRQGIPMCTNYALPICNLFLNSSHIDELLLENKVEEAKKYSRLIDDVLSIDNPFYEDLVKSYPS